MIIVINHFHQTHNNYHHDYYHHHHHHHHHHTSLSCLTRCIAVHPYDHHHHYQPLSSSSSSSTIIIIIFIIILTTLSCLTRCIAVHARCTWQTGGVIGHHVMGLVCTSWTWCGCMATLWTVVTDWADVSIRLTSGVGLNGCKLAVETCKNTRPSNDNFI